MGGLGFLASTGRLFGYLALGQGLYLAATPLITRLYAPEQFGVFGQFYNYVIFVSVLVCLNYDAAIPTIKSVHRALDMMIGSLGISVIVAMLSMLFLWLATLMRWLPQGYDFLIILTACTIAAQGAFQTFQAWHIRAQDSHALGQSHVSINGGRGGAQIVGGFATAGATGLMAGELFGRLLSSGFMARGALSAARRLHWRPSIAQSQRALSEERRFLTVLLPAQAIDAAMPFAILVTIGMIYGPAVAGQYFLMRRILDVPISLVFRSVADMFYGKIAEYAHEAPERIQGFLVRVSAMYSVRARSSCCSRSDACWSRSVWADIWQTVAACWQSSRNHGACCCAEPLGRADHPGFCTDHAPGPAVCIHRAQ
ncbi:MAG: hypothetical protein U5J78_06290 [Parasphingorhabdus sp.]|nr:hypothetical protein [Parasphingorhabdus sp.]